MNIKSKIGVATLALAAATAMAIAPADARWRGHHHHHYGHHHHSGGAAIAGFAAGALIGGALASRPYYYDYAYVPAPSYGSSAVSYCMSRFKSYDPASGTYLGYDGYRHPCP